MKILIVCEGEHEQSGALKNLLVRLGGDHADYVHEDVSKIRAFHGKGSRLFKKAITCLRLAVSDSYDALVFLIDQDGQSERIPQIRQAQDYLELSLKRAMGVAIKTFDAWMLSDEQALTKVLGYTVPTQPDPEQIDNPNQKCQELLKARETEMAQREMYAKVAKHIDIEILSTRCPKGFKPFADNVKKIFP